MIFRPWVLVLCVLWTGCVAIQDSVVEGQLSKAQKFLSDPGSGLEPVAPGIWSFKYDWYRNLVLVSGEEIAVFDPISAPAASALAAELTQRFPGKKVTLVGYSHHDHIRGGALLARPDTVVLAHENVARELKLFGASEVLAPTQLVPGDHAFTWAGVKLELLHLPRSHSDAYLAVWLPESKILYAPDLVEKKGGLAIENDNFLPGVLAAHERLLALEAAQIVPGHFALCTNEDLKAYSHMIARMRVVVADELKSAGTYDATKLDPAGFTRIQQKLREEFGGVEGFNDALLFNTYYLVLAYIGGF
jgi:glyoxylase-like metal-dependent hydrolase (beta-lactamase superfamily II)